MGIRTTFEEPIAERSSPIYETKLTDAAGTVLVAAQLTTLTLTLYDLMTSAQEIVNAVDHVNILNTGRGSLDVAGLLTIQFQRADMAILNTANRFERRRALIEWTYGAGGALGDYHEIDFTIQNLAKVPYP